MFIRTCLYGAAIAAIALSSQSVSASDRVKVGALLCKVDARSGLTDSPEKQLQCIFASPQGHREHYSGMIGKLGVDVGGTDWRVYLWNVFAPRNGSRRGALAGTYVGAGESTTANAGLGESALIGGSNRSVALQPLSLQAQTGLELGNGVTVLTLR